MLPLSEVIARIQNNARKPEATGYALAYNLPALAGLINELMGHPRTNYIKISFLCEVCCSLTTQ